eukprot:TRINITY_DN348_c0_g1_i6.p2 TRINITY_DN348_c0_g1~~TRINITY_DN348_c0_g1_i6.p2  ORF type:complete len:160 (+),score=16.74 TRINITY_DN348_c0_g1_i6:1301-1780(+)
MPGSTHDSRVLRTSPLWNNRTTLLENGAYFLAADSGYPLTPYTIVPFSDDGTMTARRREFNRALSHECVLAENGIGAVKGRFPVLRQMNVANVEHACLLTHAAFILNALCDMHHDDVMADWDTTEYDDDRYRPDDDDDEEDVRNLGEVRRQHLMQQLGL